MATMTVTMETVGRASLHLARTLAITRMIRAGMEDWRARGQMRLYEAGLPSYRLDVRAVTAIAHVETIGRLCLRRISL